jgi:hypothetical protein
MIKWGHDARDARKLLDLTVIEARALKNRTHCNSISEFVSALHEQRTLEREDFFKSLVHESLLVKDKTNKFMDKINQVIK